MSLVVNTVRAADGSVVVEVRGEVDVSVVERLRAALGDAAGLWPAQVVVDLHHVTFIDSTGLSALIGGRHAARVVGARFVVRRPSPFVADRLRQLGLYDALVGDDRPSGATGVG